jgi:hypothetical protein
LIVDTPTSSPLRHVPIAARRAAVGIRPVADADDAEEEEDDNASEWGDVATTSMPEDDDEANDSDDESAVDALRDSSIAAANGVDAERSLRSTLTDDHATGAGSGTKTPLVANSRDSGSSGAGA